MACNVSDAVFRDEAKGVWTGNRTIGGSLIGVSSLALRLFNVDLVH